MLNLKQNEVFGLDIGLSSVKIIAMRREGENYKVTSAAISRIIEEPESSLRITGDQNNNSERNNAWAVRDCYASARQASKNKLKSKLAVCGVSGPEVAIREFDFPPLAEEEIEGAVNLEASLVCPFNTEQAAIDYQIIPNDNNKTKGILVAATNKLMAEKTQLVKEAGLKCVIMDIDGFALLNCFNNLVDEDESSTAAILNVGGSCTTLAMMNAGDRRSINKSGGTGRCWPFIRETLCAGDDILKEIAEDNDISLERVRKNLFAEEPNGIDLEDSLEYACEEIISDVSETLRFYSANEKSKPVEKILVCGGFAKAKGFIELLNRRLGVEVCLWNPFDSERCKVSGQCEELLRETGPIMAVAAGLAMRSI